MLEAAWSLNMSWLLPIFLPVLRSGIEGTWNIIGGPGNARQIWVNVPRKLPHR